MYTDADLLGLQQRQHNTPVHSTSISLTVYADNLNNGGGSSPNDSADSSTTGIMVHHTNDVSNNTRKMLYGNDGTGRLNLDSWPWIPLCSRWSCRHREVERTIGSINLRRLHIRALASRRKQISGFHEEESDRKIFQVINYLIM
jgi:hypothetical protein